MNRPFFLPLITLFLFAFPAFISAQDGDEPINVDSSIVVINATITDREGRPVRGLVQSQFKVFEDGKEQQIDFFQAEETPFAAVILLDTSGSMESRITMARSAAIRFLDGLRTNDVAAIYNFDNKVSLVQDFSNSRDIVDSIFNLKATGMTVLNEAIFKAAKALETRPEKRKAIIVLSDGEDTKSGVSSDKALKAALAANALIYTIDMSAPDNNGKQRLMNQGALKHYSEKTGGTFVPTPGGVAMREAFKKIVDELGNQYTLGYQPQNIKKDGKWRALELTVARANLTIRTRKGYNAPKN